MRGTVFAALVGSLFWARVAFSARDSIGEDEELKRRQSSSSSTGHILYSSSDASWYSKNAAPMHSSSSVLHRFADWYARQNSTLLQKAVVSVSDLMSGRARENSSGHTGGNRNLLVSIATAFVVLLIAGIVFYVSRGSRGDTSVRKKGTNRRSMAAERKSIEEDSGDVTFDIDVDDEDLDFSLEGDDEKHDLAPSKSNMAHMSTRTRQQCLSVVMEGTMSEENSKSFHEAAIYEGSSDDDDRFDVLACAPSVASPASSSTLPGPR